MIPINSKLKSFENIIKIATGKGEDYKTRSLLDCFVFKENYKIILLYLSKQQVLDAVPRVIYQTNFTAK